MHTFRTIQCWDLCLCATWSMIACDAVAILTSNSMHIQLTGNWYIDEGAVLRVLVKSNTNIHIDIFSSLIAHHLNGHRKWSEGTLYCKWFGRDVVYGTAAFHSICPFNWKLESQWCDLILWLIYYYECVHKFRLIEFPLDVIVTLYFAGVHNFFPKRQMVKILENWTSPS